mgnify:FL=1
MSTNILELENDLKNQNLHGIYVFYGEEKYVQQEYLKKIKKIFGELSLGINYILLDENNIDTLIADIETPAFGYPKKLIIVRNSNLFKKDCKSTMKDKFKKYVTENLEIIEESCVIVFIEETVHKFDFYKTLEKNAVVIETKPLKPAEIKNKLKRICAMYKVNIQDQNLNYLIEIAGTNMQTLINEIRKLIEFAGENGEIQKVDIDKLAIKDIQAIIFDLTDYLGSKNTEKALVVLGNLIYNKEPLQKIIITLYNHFKKLYLTKLALVERRDLVEALSLKPNQVFLTSKYKKQSEYFTINEIENILKELIDLDYKSKSGMIDLDVGLKSVLCKNC